MQVDLHHLDALRSEGFPDNPVGREFFIADHHLIAWPPIQAKGDKGQRLGGVLDQGDIGAGRCVEQALQAFTQTSLDL